MPKRKKTGSASCSRSPKIFEETDFCHPSSQTVLSDLPDELLRHIFDLLDPQTLVAISNLKIPRLNDQTYFKSADFSVCNTIGFQDLVSYFNRERVIRLKEINFNNLFFVQPLALVACIGKCRSLTKLSILNCGINFTQLITIFGKCSRLEELYWSIKDGSPNRKMEQEKKVVVKNIKKLYLQGDVDKTSKIIPLKLLDMCPCAEEFIINFSPCYVTSLPANSADTYIKIRRKLRHVQLIINCNTEAPPRKVQRYMYFTSLMPPREIWSYDGKPLHFYFTYMSSYMKYCNATTAIPGVVLKFSSIEAVVLMLAKNGRVLTNHLNHIERISGKGLKHLSLFNSMSDPGDNPVCTHVCDNLFDTIANSCNITILDLSELHLSCMFPFSVLCHLKKLKEFSVSTCCFSLIKEGQQHSVEDYQNSFQNFILECNKVEKFCINDCEAVSSNCISPPMNDLLTPVSKWPELKCLVLQNVRELRECHFLVQVANSCPRLQFLEFFDVGKANECLFMSSIKHVLITAKELKFLRINHTAFYPMDALLWSNIEKAQKLQGLCLATRLPTFIENKTVINAIEKLPHLHLFHLIAKRCSGNLGQLVNRCMTNNGIKVPDVKVINLQFITIEPYQECNSRHFPL